MRTFKHYTWDERLRLETMLRDGVPKPEIAERLGFHISNIYREIARGAYEHRNSDWTTEPRYAADVADRKYRAHLAAKGAELKLGKDHDFAKYIEKKIVQDKYSPAAALMDIKRRGLQFAVHVCATTLYSYIDKGVFLTLSNEHLPVKALRETKQGYRPIRRARAPKGESIEKRPAEVADRKIFGHWEMDTVKGKQGTKKTLLVLTERLTRNEIKLPMSDGTKESTVMVLDGLERRYGAALFRKVFKSITVDNGSEFADWRGIERSALHPGENRTKIYCCHPYSSWERGSNENQNKLIRRWIPKGTPIENYSDEYMRHIEDWMNDYPRALFGGKSSAEMFAIEMEKLANSTA